MIHTTDQQWARSLVADLPHQWAGSLLASWEKRRASFNPLVSTSEGIARRKANEAIRARVALVRPLSAMLPLKAWDRTVRAHAWDMASQAKTRLTIIEGKQDATRDEAREAVQAAGFPADLLEQIEHAEQFAALVPFCIEAGIKAPEADTDLGAVRRMVDARWWTLRLRKAHAKAIESAAVRLGMVRRDRQCYVSDVSLEAREEQNARNAAALAATIARNLETKQEFTLAQLAAKGTGNKAIRRAELMTRINGFERIAISAAHAGLFLTMTCPAKMHRMKTQGARTVKNGRWDGTTPDLAQKYLAKVWARIRAALARLGVVLYGFRIAEPQHDGTPHWHCLFFYEQKHDAVVRATVRRYALAMDGDEPGAQEKRCDFRTMDPAKGTAAGYIAKYVAKNIDGYRLEKDLEGNDSLETSARVEAWASRWRIRQFQQIGGPPVTVWRELRRVENVPADAPDFVRKAHNAVNKVAVIEGRENASVAWNHYVEAQGGIACGRNYRVRLATVENATPNRYGEQGAAKVIGIEYPGLVRPVIERHGIYMNDIPRVRPITIESRRFTWEILKGKRASSTRTAVSPVTAYGGLYAGIVGACSIRGFEGLGSGLKREHRASWTRVNNCTESGDVLRRHGESVGYRAGGVSENRGENTARDVGKADTARKTGSKKIH